MERFNITEIETEEKEVKIEETDNTPGLTKTISGVPIQGRFVRKKGEVPEKNNGLRLVPPLLNLFEMQIA